MSDCCLQCDGDCCLNRGGGTPATTTPTRKTKAADVPAWRARAEYTRGERTQRAKNVALRAENKARGLCHCGRERLDKTYVCCESCRRLARVGSRESVTQ